MMATAVSPLISRPLRYLISSFALSSVAVASNFVTQSSGRLHLRRALAAAITRQSGTWRSVWPQEI
jgi:hypothetical protein